LCKAEQEVHPGEALARPNGGSRRRLRRPAI
jgi:hypothetical protein